MSRSIHPVKLVPLTDERRQALIAASIRLGLRLEYALEGVPAYRSIDIYQHTGEPFSTAHPLVPGAPPWAEDPRTLTTGLARIDQALNAGKEYVAC
jgi:hypothetical protein